MMTMEKRRATMVASLLWWLENDGVVQGISFEMVEILKSCAFSSLRKRLRLYLSLTGMNVLYSSNQVFSPKVHEKYYKTINK